MSECAACGKGGDNLKNCPCKLAKYCNASCQLSHRPKHKKECKKRTTEIFAEQKNAVRASAGHDRMVTSNITSNTHYGWDSVKKVTSGLFARPPPKDDCPICFLPLPGASKITYQFCCGKVICDGCIYVVEGNVEKENEIRTLSRKPLLPQRCPLCREPSDTSDKETAKRCEKRMKANDADAFYTLGCEYQDGTMGMSQDSNKAFELWLRAGELGSNNAHGALATAYYQGKCVGRNLERANHYFELAAMGGNEIARHNLGLFEQRAGNMNRAIKHWVIAAEAGYEPSLKRTQEGFSTGHATRDEYEKALRAYKGTRDDMESLQRDVAAAARALALT
mmetsp:Transcript_8356/g.13528  ORF Transcript_8356/g.13528 Transcript_8356/m.13528 type:complete len:336 (-) Transcript_8356:80-1087(-)